jgi:hypothetical protein
MPNLIEPIPNRTIRARRRPARRALPAPGPIHSLTATLVLTLALAPALGLLAPAPAWSLPQNSTQGASQVQAESRTSVVEASATSEASGLRAEVERDFEVLPIRGGVLLRPRAEFRGVRTVELMGSTIAINGETESRQVVRGWLGDKADAVLRLADLAPAERRRVLGVTEEAGPEEAQGSAPAAEAQEGASAGTEASAESGSAVGVAPVPPTPTTPAPPERPRHRSHRGGQTGFGSSVYVDRDEVVDDVVVFGGSVTVEGRVEGGVVVIGGTVHIDGEVTQDVTVVGGSINLGPNARVRGDVNAIGGAVHRSPGAEIGGRVEEVEHGFYPWWRTGPWSWRTHWSPWRVWDVAWPLTGLVILALLVALIVAVGRRPVERIATRAGLEPLKAGIVGLLVAIFTVPVVVIVCVVLAVTVIGIPIMVVFLLLFIFVGIPAFFVFSLVGYSAVALRVGRWAEGRFGWRLESPLVAAVVGVFVLGVLGLIGDFLGIFGGAVSVFSVMFGVVGGCIQFLAWAVGFGALFVVLYERRGRSRAVPPPPPAQGLPPAAPVAPAPPAEPPPEAAEPTEPE